MRTAAWWTFALAWIWCIGLFVRNWFRVQAHRRQYGETWEGRLEDKPSRLGLYLQGGLFLAFIRGGPARPTWLICAAALLAIGSTIFLRHALNHLGAQWRVNTVVTTDHKLITTGPYSLVRHPVYTGLLGMNIATAVAIAWWPFGIISLIIYWIATELRVKAEDRLLHFRFDVAHRVWCATTPAWIPWFRQRNSCKAA
ncbi:MAG: isoprenylcysteine carboxylmethyltransferase family protein [Bryobacteraceae bacterium]